MKAIFILIAALIATPAWADMYKCVNGMGRVTFSDTPCGNGAIVLEKSNPPAMKNKQADERKLPPPKMIEFPADNRMALIKASALLDNIKTLGWECQWALKVDKKTGPCISFLEKIQAGGEASQIDDKVTQLMKNRAFVSANMAEFNLIRQHTEDIARYSEFMSAYLRNR
ncbi:MAG: DUF4124 domain-containing protein [Pseudomonadota bacterium]